MKEFKIHCRPIVIWLLLWSFCHYFWIGFLVLTEFLSGDFIAYKKNGVHSSLRTVLEHCSLTQNIHSSNSLNTCSNDWIRYLKFKETENVGKEINLSMNFVSSIRFSDQIEFSRMSAKRLMNGVLMHILYKLYGMRIVHAMS